MTCYYKILEVAKDVEENELKKKYKKLALKHHPDKNFDNIEEATKKFQLISVAYEVLSDPEQRKRYDNSDRFCSANDEHWSKSGEYWSKSGEDFQKHQKGKKCGYFNKKDFKKPQKHQEQNSKKESKRKAKSGRNFKEHRKGQKQNGKKERKQEAKSDESFQKRQHGQNRGGQKVETIPCFHTIDLTYYCSFPCFKGFSDGDDGFYSVYRNLFKRLSEENRYHINSPTFGDESSNYETVVEPFYAYWSNVSVKVDLSLFQIFFQFFFGGDQVDQSTKDIKTLAKFVRRIDRRVTIHLNAVKAENMKKRK